MVHTYKNQLRCLKKFVSILIQNMQDMMADTAGNVSYPVFYVKIQSNGIYHTQNS